ncbi:uncharacterized protein LY89DRAFT_781173 [Mollisia scopiformis]|uniref:Zn(2)-C6 fungal-type domain-containing protein n=1 Tax=Mollisia scopiformis TaxID=149040 RepID=A0A194XD28_MOLSC|nr:uncharacterized protein LY89DRAFT_781173 [Mollisia scopiformis]KUJ18078.1 hypothetical protein LY89DRAFT_781173 [Mollisia scopiformis]
MTVQGEQASDITKRPQRANGHRLTRRRIPLSCTACRVRKLKCNREKPCQNCIVRGDATAASCTYAEKAEKKYGQAGIRSDEDMRKRLNRLENSILTMISNDAEHRGSQTDSANHPSPANSTGSPGHTGAQRISSDTRSTHWDAILNDLGAMKEAWIEENDKIEFTNGFEEPVITKPHRPGLFSGLTQPPDRATILATLPIREAADKLVVRFFDYYNPAIPSRYVLHKATFLKQYNQHWVDPSKTKIIWIGMLYSMYCIAMQSWIRGDEVPPEYEGTAPALVELYRVRTVQCLIVSDITKPVEFMIETMNLYSQIEYAEEKDGNMGSYVLSGTMFRLALQQGYHRDPSQHPNLTVFQGEMRRRVWSAVSQHDLLFSVHVGLPKSIRYAEGDTLPPRNLHEHELYEDMTELPPARPLTEDTQVSYQVFKWHLMRAYGRVIEFVHLLEPQPYEDVLKIDMALLNLREMIPPHLLLGTLEEMQNDAPGRVMEKYIIQLFYNKAVCLLHRKYWDGVPTSTDKNTWYYSRKTSVMSALTLLEHQVSMHQASKPGGCLGKFKWYNFSITNNDFLLAAMILCLDLMSIRGTAGRPDVPECIINEIDKLNAIKRSRDIWQEIIDDCPDARRAVKVLTGVLAKLSTKKWEDLIPSANSDTNSTPAVSASAQNPNVDSLRYSPYFTDQFGLGCCLRDQPDTVMGESFIDTMSTDLSTADFNWDIWDQFMAGQTQPDHDFTNDIQQQQQQSIS